MASRRSVPKKSTDSFITFGVQWIRMATYWIFRDLLKSEPWAIGRVLDELDQLERDFLKLKMGMVRASFGLYTTPTDIDALIDGSRDIAERQEYYRSVYQTDAEGNYRHRNAVNSRGLIRSIRSP